MSDFKYKGYCSKLLRVNLTSQTASEEPLNESDVERFIGGRGLGAKILFDEVKEGVEPLSPENKLIITTGPLTGTRVPTSTNRFIITTKSPLTGIYGFSVSGGAFGLELKKAGYDGLVIEGKANKPTYLQIEDGELHFRDAGWLWGIPVFEATRLLRETLGYDYRTIMIGPSGEKLVKIAGIISDDRRASARCGVGAVMGSKLLKAVAVKGSKEYTVADPAKFDEALKEAFKNIGIQPGPWKEFRQTGTQSGPIKNNAWGILPTANWRESVFDKAAEISYPLLRERFVVKDTGCNQCPIRCTKLTLVKDGPYAGAATDGPEYETIYAFGSACKIGDPRPIIAADMLCDDLGLDTMSTGLTIAWAMEALEKNAISKSELDGLNLRFGSDEGLLNAIKKMAYRDGALGKLLSDGVREAARKVGKGSESYAMHVKGLEIGGYDPRGSKGQGLVLAAGSRGGCHHAYGVASFVEIPQGTATSAKGKGLLVKGTLRVRVMIDSSPLCAFAASRVPPPLLARLISAATGMEMQLSDLERAADRIATLERAYNAREGVRREHDTLPDRLLKEAVPDGPNKGAVLTPEELELMKTELYEAMGWDTSTGIPKRSTLEALGLADVASDLARAGCL
ncbi:MAG: aldehyde ferredoxin oxidoreductase family protein [Nitrososphaerales archaeon]